MWYLWKLSLFTENWGVKLSSNFAQVGSHTHHHWSRPSQCERRPFGDKKSWNEACMLWEWIKMRILEEAGECRQRKLGSLCTSLTFWCFSTLQSTKTLWWTSWYHKRHCLMFRQEAWSAGHCGWVSSVPSAELTPSRVLGHAAHPSYACRANSCNGPRQIQLFSCQWLAIHALNCSTSMEYSLLYLSN